MARGYETLGRRFLAILAEGGPRKPNVLRSLYLTDGGDHEIVIMPMRI